MSGLSLRAGFLPLVDAGPLIVARELGFAAEQGVDLQLSKAPSWSTLRDMVALGQVEAAQMLAPMPIAAALGLSGPVRLAALQVLSVNGTVTGVSPRIAARMQGADLSDATATGRALIAAAEGPLRIGVPFPFSMQAELLYYWLGALGLPAPQALQIRTIPPPLMADAMARGEIDAFCVGEPWGSVAVEQGVGELILPGAAIWGFAPEKLLVTRADWAERETALAQALIRAVWRAGRWLDDPVNRTTAAELLSRPEHVNVAPELIERALAGRLVVNARGAERIVPNFAAFHRGAASFPWRSQAGWIGRQMAGRFGLDRAEAERAAMAVMRTDLFRGALAPEGADLPGASMRIEGALRAPARVASTAGKLVLEADAFFDRRIFDLSAGD